MKVTLLVVVCFLFAINYSSNAQSGALWNNKKCAVALTYDDALNVHPDNAIPVLDSLKLKATFYLSNYNGVLGKRIDDWRRIAKNGHELANHTYYHPCTGKIAGREFVSAKYDLSTYSIDRITDEIRMNNTLLKAIDGKDKRTFAYPCGDTKIGDSFYLAPLRDDFIGARGTKSQMLKLDQVDLYNIGCYVINGQSGQQLIDLVKKAMSTNTFLVFLFHGVGGEHSLNVSLTAHRDLLQFLNQNQKDVWVAPLIDIAEYIKSNKQNKPKTVSGK